MRILIFIFLLSFASVFAQKTLALDTLKVRETKVFFVDDYGGIYIYKNKNFSLTKYDSLGKEQGRMMLTVPFKVQNVQNPLNIVLFSENAQELKFIDQNLNEIQKIDFRQKFGFIKSAYAEDLQQIWLLDESTKRLLQYNYRDDKIINSYPFNIDFEKISEMLVYENRLYMLTDNAFFVYDFKAKKIFENEVSEPRKLRRENDNIFIISKSGIQKYTVPNSFKTVFKSEKSQIVDKNSVSYFELKGNKIYLYKLEK